MIAKDLTVGEYNPYYQTYIDKANALAIPEGLSANSKSVVAFFESIPKDKLEYRYAEGKWTIKELLHHIIDTERIFAYRALRVARKDKTPLPGFDENEYVLPAKSNDRSIESLLNEYKAVRQATLALFETFTNEMLIEIGTASNSPISARAIGFIITGHENHHCEVVKERYL
ncbi:MAG: DinB family protein [Gelidibacter sp.]